MGSETRFLSAASAAARLGLPKAWLMNEADAGRLPCLRIGRRMLFNIDAVERALSARAAGQHGDDGKAVPDAR